MRGWMGLGDTGLGGALGEEGRDLAEFSVGFGFEVLLRPGRRIEGYTSVYGNKALRCSFERRRKDGGCMHGVGCLYIYMRVVIDDSR